MTKTKTLGIVIIILIILIVSISFSLLMIPEEKEINSNFKFYTYESKTSLPEFNHPDEVEVMARGCIKCDDYGNIPRELETIIVFYDRDGRISEVKNEN